MRKQRVFSNIIFPQKKHKNRLFSLGFSNPILWAESFVKLQNTSVKLDAQKKYIFNELHFWTKNMQKKAV